MSDYHISHTRLYSLKGGIIRFKFSTANLKEAVDAETQFVARNMRDGAGEPDKDKMSGPDDMEFVLRTLKSASETFDAFIPKHLKPQDISMVIYSDQEITITLAESGHTSKTAVGQVYELMRSFLLNFILQMWYQKCSVPQSSESFAGLSALARQSMQRVLMHSFKVRRTYGSRYPVITFTDIALPLQGKFLGSYRTAAAMDAVHPSDLEVADMVYREDEADYMIYNGATWDKLSTLIAAATAIDAKDGEDYPDDAELGDLYKITRSGTMGEHNDRVYAGDLLLCIRDNRESEGNYKNNLENFITIGSINQD